MIATLIRKLPKPVEFFLVVLVCFWWAIYAEASRFITRQWSNTSHPAQQQYVGIGVELGEKEHQVVIVQAMPNTPASRAGLLQGMVIQKVDGIATAGKSAAECGDMMRGIPGGTVKLELVLHNKTNTVEVTREMVWGSPLLRMTDMNFLMKGCFELFGLAVMFWIARVRNWPLGEWGFRPSWKLTGAGVLLFLAMALVIIGLVESANLISPGIVHRYTISFVSWTAVALFSVCNGVFEETLESGYFIQTLQGYGMWPAVLASTIFRTFLHTYLGMGALIIVLPFGLVFGFVYWKWRRLWPLFVAHMIFDFIAYIPEYHAP